MSGVSSEMDRLVELARAGAGGDDSTLAGSAFSAHVDRVRAERGPGAVAEIVRGVLLCLAERHHPLIGKQAYPPEVLASFEGEFKRILDSAQSADPDRLDTARYALRCDLRILCFSRVPVGISHLELGAIPRRYLVSGGLGQAVRFGGLLARTGGLAPYYVTHLRHYGVTPLNFFIVNSPENRERMFLLIAECLKMHPRCLGCFSASWWLDPALDEFTPHLKHIRTGIVDNGGMLLRYGVDENAVRDALANSPARQKLYREGRYQPTSYAFVWPRRALLAWARRRAAEST